MTEIYLRTATRKDMSKQGLINTLLSVFSDEDTNGNNGIEYLSSAAAEYFNIDIDNIKTDTHTEAELQKYTTDNYHAAMWKELSDEPEITEDEIVAKAFKDYSSTCTNYCSAQEYDVVYNDEGKIGIIIYAYVPN